MDQRQVQKDRVIWRTGGVPMSERFDDPYYSLEDGLAETTHVFLDGNGLPARFYDGFHVAELGFGTGLNALATAAAWTGEGQFRFTSFEAFPMAVEDMRIALSRWDALAKFADVLVREWATGARRIAIGQMDLHVIEGDVRETLPAWEGAADAWYLDGFSPAKNPAMWSPEVLAEVGRHTAPGGSFATYTAASAVRMELMAAGFTVERVPGFGRKRHMSVGRK